MLGTKLYFRGYNSSVAVFDMLMKKYNLGTADKIILTGSSAGGLGTFSWTQYLRDLLPSSVKLVSVPDSGYFIDYYA